MRTLLLIVIVTAMLLRTIIVLEINTFIADASTLHQWVNPYI